MNNEENIRGIGSNPVTKSLSPGLPGKETKVNLIYKAIPQKSIDRIIYELKSEISNLKRKNRKLNGIIRKNKLDYMEENNDEFISYLDELSLGDVVEIVCNTDKKYVIEGRTYEWCYTTNRVYKALVVFVPSVSIEHVTLFIMDLASAKPYYKCQYELVDKIDIWSGEIEKGKIQIRIIHKATKENMEFEK
jgi:hypothetical protein